MRTDTHYQTMPSMTQVIGRHLLSFIHETSMTMSAFTITVRAHYERAYLPHARVIEWSQHPDLSERERLDSEMLTRWLMGLTIKKQLSIDLLDSVIYAFAPDRRFRLQIELAARQGMITFPVSSSTASVDALFLGRIAKEVGDVLIAGAGLLEDGVIDSRDRVKAPSF